MLASRKMCKIVCLITIVILIIVLQMNYGKGPRDRDPFIILQEEYENEPLKETQLVNLHDFRYRLKSDLCEKFTSELLGVMIVTSYVGHDALRSAHRQAITQKKLNEMGLLRVFLLADIPPHEKFINQNQIEDEHQKFGDLIQGNFQEAYRNLTYKHIMGLKWAATECRNAKFVIKIDDDIVFDIFFIKNYLETLELNENVKNFMAGYVCINLEPIRQRNNKWFVTRQEFSQHSYPSFLSGWLYMMNLRVAEMLVRESQHSKFFWIDDVFVTGMLRDSLAIPLIQLKSWYSANSQFLECCVRDLKEHSYECEFYVGPNGGDNRLIIDFVHEVERCYFDECIKRPPEHDLRRTCVARAKNLLSDHGEAIVKAVPLR